MSDRILIVACGPSIAGVDIEVPPSVHVIAVNNAVTWAPVVHSFFSLDPSREVRRLLSNRRPGVQYVMAVPDDYGMRRSKLRAHRAPREAGVKFLRRITGNGVRGSSVGLSEDPGAIHTGNSAFGALGLAYHMRPNRISLLGVDGTDNGYAYLPGSPRWSLAHLPGLFASAVGQLESRGIEVVNGSPQSRVTCFPRMTPEAALEWLK